MKKLLLILVTLALFVNITKSQSKVEFWGKFKQNVSHVDGWVDENYEPLLLQDSVLYTSLLQAGFLSQINLGKKTVITKFITMPPKNTTLKGLYYCPVSFIPYKNGFLTAYANSISFFDKNGEKPFFRPADTQTIEQIIGTASGNIIVFCLDSYDARLILMDHNGGILYQLKIEDPLIPCFRWWPAGDKLRSEYFDVKIEDKRLIKLKNKQTDITDKSLEFSVGAFKNYFFLYSKKKSNKLIVRNNETSSRVGEIILPNEMVQLIKNTKAYKQAEYMPIMRIVSLNNNRHFIVFSSGGFLYVYALSTTL